jgi:hypothetical protein
MTETSAQSVTVRRVTGQQLAYEWATSVRVDRRGNLRVLEGWRQRAFHPRDEWVFYTVPNPRREQEKPEARFYDSPPRRRGGPSAGA